MTKEYEQLEQRYKLCTKCKYSGCIYEQSLGSLECSTWCKNYLKSAHGTCKCGKYLRFETPTCEYFEEGEALSSDELIDKENPDYKRYLRIAKRLGFDDD